MSTPIKGVIKTMGDKVPAIVVTFQFNPTEITLEKSVTIAEIPIPGLAAPLQQFVRGNAEKISMDLFFDATDTGMGEDAKGVIEQTDKVFSLLKIVAATHAPPVCEFSYGNPFPGSTAIKGMDGARDSFRFVMESVRQRFTLFSPAGVALRATLSVVMREYRAFTDQLDKLGLNSPDRTQSRVLQRGETLTSLAADHYHRPGEWRRIANANAIRDPRRLAPGTFLILPPTP